MSLFIHKNIAIVSILDIQDETSNRVCCHGLDKITSCPLILNTIDMSESLSKIVHQIHVIVAQLMTRHGVGHALDDALAIGGSDNTIWV